MQKNEQKPAKPHNIALEERKILKATGILDVEGFDDTKIHAMLGEASLTIGGKNLKVIAFSSESGELLVEGEIDSLEYSAAFSRKAGFFKKVFR
ncbi:MAG: YabP/YqfC family sporulation protein [Oscillospiraceae bacterium]|nr:YabP/YqfC family sporulation protein [Oscillospiraceae bacterium]MBR3952136.1 YabP/YqfC family sporulation protein [Oscillospiraceae bacterium]